MYKVLISQNRRNQLVRVIAGLLVTMQNAYVFHTMTTVTIAVEQRPVQMT